MNLPQQFRFPQRDSGQLNTQQMLVGDIQKCKAAGLTFDCICQHKNTLQGISSNMIFFDMEKPAMPVHFEFKMPTRPGEYIFQLAVISQSETSSTNEVYLKQKIQVLKASQKKK